MTCAVNQSSIKVIASSIVEDEESIEVEFLFSLHRIRQTDETEKDEMGFSRNEVSSSTSEGEDGSSQSEHILKSSAENKEEFILKTISRIFSTDDSEESFYEKPETTLGKVSSSPSPSNDSTMASEVDVYERKSELDPLMLQGAVVESIFQYRESFDLNQTTTNPENVEGDSLSAANETTNLHSASHIIHKENESPMSDGIIPSSACNDKSNEKEGDLNQEGGVDNGREETRLETKALSENASPERQNSRRSYVDAQQQAQTRVDTSFVSVMFDYMNITSSPSQDESIIGEIDGDSCAGEISVDDGCQMRSTLDEYSNLDDKRFKEKMTKDMFEYILRSGSDDASLMDLNSSSSDEIDTMSYNC